jgi:hypothetical protein
MVLRDAVSNAFTFPPPPPQPALHVRDPFQVSLIVGAQESSSASRILGERVGRHGDGWSSAPSSKANNVVCIAGLIGYSRMVRAALPRLASPSINALFCLYWVVAVRVSGVGGGGT